VKHEWLLRGERLAGERKGRPIGEEAEERGSGRRKSASEGREAREEKGKKTVRGGKREG